MTTSITSHPIVLFDGVCNLCNRSIQFIIERDQDKTFRFASLQSPVGQTLLKQFNLPTDQFDSFILVDKNQYYTQSSAALQVIKRFSGLWKLGYIGIVIPKRIRDWMYQFVAKNRYRWFGKRDQCWLPTPELKERFL